MKNKIIAHFSIIMILLGVFCNVCTMGISLSRNDKLICYASADNWSSCDNSDLVKAFRYYCKSRNLALEGSYADALTSFTTSTFNNICSTLGIDPTTLSAELKKTTEGNLGLRYLFSNTGITAYNRIFAEFLQNNDLDVGDSVDNKVLYTGKSFNDGNGHSCLIYVVTATGDQKDISNITQYGSSFMYSSSYLYNNAGTYTFNINNRVYSVSFSVRDNQNQNMYWMNGCSGVQIRNLSNENTTSNINDNMSHCFYTVPQVSNTKNSVGQICNGDFTVYSYNNQLYLGTVSYFTGESYYNHHMSTVGIPILDSEGTTDDVDVTINTPENTVINNNTYNNNYVIIYNDGDTYISDDDDEPLPTTPPSGGGGGGGGNNPDNPDTPDIPPVDPTPTPPPTIPDWDIELPEMPTGNDWLLYGLEKKFPWDIPFNLMYMLSLFAADPETPHFEGTLDLKIVQWDYDIDLAPFDDIARNVRNFEFIGFLLGLMLLTRKLIWG